MDFDIHQLDRMAPDSEGTEAAFEVFQQALTETLNGIHQIRASNREQHYISQVTRLAQEVKDHGIAFACKRIFQMRILRFLPEL